LKGTVRTTEKRLRRSLRAGSDRVLALFGGRGGPSLDRLDATAIHQVLVVRANGRMGNTLFLTPLIVALNEVAPHAAIDVFVHYADAADLLLGLPGVRNVITLPRAQLRRPRELFATLRRLRATTYDLVIDPQVNSSGGRMVARLARARWRLGFAGRRQWLKLDFAAQLPAGLRHEALRPLALVEQAFDFRSRSGPPRLHVGSSAEERAEGARLFAERSRSGTRQPGPGTQTIGFFAMARGDKDLGAAWWREFWTSYLALRPATVPLEVLPTATQAPVDPSFATVHCPSPRTLAATLAGADAFFSADTGPMHLASAAGVPTIAFFEQTSPAAYGPIKPSDTVLRIAGMTPQSVAAACAGIVATREGRVASAPPD